MAQHPWKASNLCPITAREAAQIVRRCGRDVRKRLTAATSPLEVVHQIVQAADALSTEKKYYEPFEAVDSAFQGSPGGIEVKKERRGASFQGDSATSTAAPSSKAVFLKADMRGLAQLHPAFVQNPGLGVRLFLCSNYLLKYIPELKAFWLGYLPNSLVNTDDNVGFVSDAEPLAIINFEVQFTGLLFRPFKNGLLVGKVQQVRPTHVSLLVMGLFPATLSRRELDRKFSYTNDSFRDIKGNNCIEIGSYIRFRVWKTHGTPVDNITIEGSLSESDGGLLELMPETPS